MEQSQQQGELIRPVQTCVKDRNIPPEIRANFVTKVYSLMIFMLVISFGVAAPFVFNPVPAKIWMNNHFWILALVTVFLAVQQMFNMMLLFEACCGGNGLFQMYLRMFTRVPLNYIVLCSYAACFGVVLGYICAYYTASSVCIVFALTASMMFALTIYAITTKSDFSGCAPFILVVIMGMLMLGIISIFTYNDFIYKAYGVLGAILMSFVIIFDTQLIFGTAAFNCDNHAAKIEFTIDMYAFAAYQLYLDFVNMFLYLLRVFGERR